MPKWTAAPLLSLALLFGGCDDPEPTPPSPPTSPSAPAAEEGSLPSTTIRGRVLETMDSGGYTYMRLETTNGPTWVATSPRPIAVGANVQVSGVLMQRFFAESLDRTFDQLVLASSVRELDR